MPNESGWIKLHRKILKWEWYDSPSTKDVFLHLLLIANIEPAKWHGITVERGQVVTSLSSIAIQTGLSVKQVRTAIERLEKAQSVARSAYSKYTVFTVIGYDEYQERAQSAAIEGQAEGKQTANKGQQYKNNKNIRIKEKENNSPPFSPEKEAGVKEDNELFLKFWNAYPKKTAKQDALKAWKKLNPDEELFNVILSSLEAQKKSPQWTKDNKRFIPYPATWLNGRRWEDEVTYDNSPPKYDSQKNYEFNGW